MTDILIVEDNKELAELLRDFLRAAGYSTAIAENGEEKTYVATFEEADNAVIDGINLVLNWLDEERIHIVEEKCKNIIREFNSYIWDEKAQEKGEDKPIKQNDHALDALRYLLQTLFPNKKRGAYFV